MILDYTGQVLQLDMKLDGNISRNFEGFITFTKQFIELTLIVLIIFLILIDNKMFQSILQIIDKHQLFDDTILTQRLQAIRSKIGEQFYWNQQKSYRIGSQYNPDKPKLHDIAQQAIQLNPSVNIEQYDDLKIRKKFEYWPLNNKKFKKYFYLHKVYGEIDQQLQAKEGEVLVVVVWNTSWESQQNQLINECQKLMAKNEKQWKGKVRMVGISTDYNAEDVVEMILNKGWDRIEFYITHQEQNTLSHDFLGMQKPIACIVDKKGFARYHKKHGQVDIEQNINQLIDQNKQSWYSTLQSYQNYKLLNSFKIIQKLFSEDFFHNQFANTKLFTLQGIIKRQMKMNKYHHQVELNATISQFDTNYLNILKQMIKGITSVNVNHKVQQIQEIPFGTNCVDCHNQFGNDFYYYCKWDSNPNKFRCIECIQKKNENEYRYKKNAILKKGNKTQIALKRRLGRNIQPQFTPINNRHSFKCSGPCTKDFQPNTARHICLDCYLNPKPKQDGFVDLCKECMDKYIAGNKKIINILKLEGHKDDHIFLRILYNVQGYYIF